MKKLLYTASILFWASLALARNPIVVPNQDLKVNSITFQGGTGVYKFKVEAMQ